MDSQFTQRVSDIILYGKEEANRLRNGYVGPEHLLLGMIREGENKAIEVLESLYVDVKKIKYDLESVLRQESAPEEGYDENITFNDKATRILKDSILEAKLMQSPAADVQHILLAIMREDRNRASEILEEYDVTYGMIADRLAPKSEPQAGLDFGEEDEDEEEMGPRENNGWETARRANRDTELPHRRARRKRTTTRRCSTPSEPT